MDAQSTGGPSTGQAVHPVARPHKLTNRTGSDTVVGLVLCFDLQDTLDAATTTFDPRDGAKSAFGNGVLPSAKDVKHGVSFVCMEVFANDATGKVVSQGLIDGLCVSAGSATAEAGDPLAIDTSGHFELDTAAGEKYFALFAAADEALTTAVETHQVLFNGWHGFGLNHGT